MSLGESQKCEFFELWWDMETWGWCSGRVHCKISCCFSCCVIKSEKVGIEWVCCLISQNNAQINSKMSFPSFWNGFSWGWDSATSLRFSREFWAVSRRIVDVRKEKYSFWTDLNFPICRWITVHRWKKYLYSIFLIKGIVAFGVSRYDLFIYILPWNEKRFFIMTETGSGGWVQNTVSVSEGNTDTTICTQWYVDCWHR